MKTQEKISADRLRSKVGKKLRVIVDEPGVGRSMADAPEIDGLVKFAPGKSGGKTGEFVNIHIDRAEAHDLFGRPV